MEDFDIQARSDCVAHVVHGSRELNPDSTVMPTDGISAYDQISRWDVRCVVHATWRRGNPVRAHVLRNTVDIRLGRRRKSGASHSPGGEHWGSLTPLLYRPRQNDHIINSW